MTASPATASASSRREPHTGMPDLVPGTSRNAVLLAYDLLHYLCLHGQRQPREVVIDYLARGGLCSLGCRLESRLRAFERFKTHLSRLGVRHHSFSEYHGRFHTPWFEIEDPRAAKRLLQGLLDQTIPRAESELDLPDPFAAPA